MNNNTEYFPLNGPTWMPISIADRERVEFHSSSYGWIQVEMGCGDGSIWLKPLSDGGFSISVQARWARSEKVFRGGRHQKAMPMVKKLVKKLQKACALEIASEESQKSALDSIMRSL